MGVRCRFAAVAAAHLVVLAVCANAYASPPCPGDDVQPTSATSYDSAMALVCDMNQLRAQNGLRPLKWDWRLWTAAQKHAADMAAQTYFSHVSMDGRTLEDRVRPTGYIPKTPTWILSENLGFGTNVLSTPSSIAEGWMDSPAHRENLLDQEVRDVGVGLAQGDVLPDEFLSGTIFVADFGTRGAATTPKKRAVAKTDRSHGSTGSVKSRDRSGRARRR
jgi:uncharacterized protein YkwD